MADTVRFIHEAPQKATRKKTRPRLVKACDSCRTRKLKCDQIIHGTVCRACNEAGLTCQFKDRERYYELRQSIDRVRALTGPLRGTCADSSVSSTSPPAASCPELGVSSEPSIAHVLFDPFEPDYPGSILMFTYVDMFYTALNTSFPNMSYAKMLGDLSNKTMRPLMANCIAALAVSSCGLSEIGGTDVKHVAGQYTDKAEELLASGTPEPTFETLQSLVLLAWAELYRSCYDKHNIYGWMAVKMALELRLNDPSIARLDEDADERNTLWGCVNTLFNSINAVASKTS